MSSVKSARSKLPPLPPIDTGGPNWKFHYDASDDSTSPDSDADLDSGSDQGTHSDPGTNLAPLAEEKILDNLREHVQPVRGSPSANYACGRTVPIVARGDKCERLEHRWKKATGSMNASSITLRFNNPNGKLAKVKFPLLEDSGPRELEELLGACTLMNLGSKDDDFLGDMVRTPRKLENLAWAIVVSTLQVLFKEELVGPESRIKTLRVDTTTNSVYQAANIPHC